jgi:CBS domain-containing protein
MRVSEIMTKDPVCCTEETHLDEVAKMMLTHDCGSIPVCENEDSRRVIGVVTDRDIAVRAVASGRDPKAVTAKECMSHPVAVVRDDASVEECIKTLEENRIRRIPVVNTRNQIVGIVAQADIARSAPEEVVGELVHEVSQGVDLGHR